MAHTRVRPHRFSIRAALHFALSLSIEFGPVAAFFIAYTTTDNFFFSVKALILATVLSLVVAWVRDRRVPIFSLAVSGFVIVTGLMTLVTQNPYWIVFEYTSYNIGFACIIAIAEWRNVPILGHLFKAMFHISDNGWRVIARRWGVAFLVTGVSNEVVYRLMSEDAWIEFRFIAAVLLAIFGFAQLFTARKERMPESSPWGLRTVFHK